MEDRREHVRAPGFGALLRRYRLAAGLSQEALAERARMSTEGISALERGFRRSPQRETLALLADALALDREQRSAFEEAAVRPGLQRGAHGASVAAGPWSDAALSNLPFAIASFIGREGELGEIAVLVRNHRLVTITGAGGVGKTQTALHLARAYDADTPIRFVGLASIRDGSLVLSAIAAAIGVQEAANRSLLETLIAYLKSRAMLLLLDNCEHVIEEAARVTEELLSRCARLRILATSREALMATGERRYQMPSLKEEEAVSLFVDRAQAVDARFNLSDGNKADITKICRRLDCIPLAIELAAARINVLPLRELDEKLDDRFQILSGSARSAIPRQRTMRAAIDWSYELLPEPERRIFERLSVFAGGCTLPAATAVCSEGGVAEGDVFDLLGSLVDKSLVTVDLSWSETRFGLLESFGQYGREKLIAREELQSVAQRHALAQLELAKHVGAMRGRDFQNAQEIWSAEQGNLRVAIGWALIERNDVELGQRLAAEVSYWEYFSPRERQQWMNAAFELVSEATSLDLRALLHKARALVHFHLREYEASVADCETALAYYRNTSDWLSIAQVQNALGYALQNLRRISEAKATFEAAVPVARMAESKTALAGILSGLALLTEDIERIRRYSTEARSIHEASGNRIGVAFALINVGICERRAGNVELSLAKELEGLAVAAELPAFARVNVMTLALHNISHSLTDLGCYDEAARRVREKLELAREHGLDYYVSASLEQLIVIDYQRRRGLSDPDEQWFVRAAKILGFVDAFLASVALQRYEESKPPYDAIVALLRKAIGADRVSQLMSEGASLTQDEAIAEIAFA